MRVVCDHRTRGDSSQNPCVPISKLPLSDLGHGIYILGTHSDFLPSQWGSQTKMGGCKWKGWSNGKWFEEQARGYTSSHGDAGTCLLAWSCQAVHVVGPSLSSPWPQPLPPSQAECRRGVRGKCRCPSASLVWPAPPRWPVISGLHLCHLLLLKGDEWY